MTRSARLVALLATLALAGCGMFEDDDRESWRTQAEEACFGRGEVQLSEMIREIDTIDGKGACGLSRPLKVTSVTDGEVRLGPRAMVMACPATSALETWIRDVVQPAAIERLGSPVVEIRSMGTYACRTRNNVPGARLSEHAFANAIDVSGFVLANGYTVTVAKGWHGTEAERAFLKIAHGGACGPFTTVLGPGSDGLHEDHLHLDLARHNAKGTYRYCKPKPEMPGRTAPPDLQMVDAPPLSEPAPWPRTMAGEPLPQSAGTPVATAVPPAGTAVAAPAAPAGVPAATTPATGQAPYCPPGYICTPVAPQAVPDLPAGWQVGPQPAIPSYTDEVTGSIGDYSDH